MKMNSILVAAIALVGMAGAAHAGTTITSGGIPTGVNNNAACYIRNVGKTPVALQAQGLINFSPGFATPSFQNCNDVPLAPGRTCVLLWSDIADDTAFACSAVIQGSAKNIRAAAELRTPVPGGLKVVASSELR